MAVLGLLLAACLWWAYFGGDDARAERALAGIAQGRRAAVAVRAFGYWHLPILLGIISLAAGLKHAIGPGRLRGAAAVLAVATVPVGVAASALLQLGLLAIVLSGSLAAESAGTWSHGRPG